MSRDEFIYIASRDGIMSIYASRQVASTYGYRLLKTAESIEI